MSTVVAVVSARKFKFMKKIILYTSLGFTLFCNSVFAQQSDDIVRKNNVAKAAALESYLEANPKATDRRKAIHHLIIAYSKAGNDLERSAELEAQLNSFILADNELLQNTQKLFSLKADAGDKQGALKVIEDAKKKLPAESDVGKASTATALAKRFAALEEKLMRQIYMPAEGDTMELKFTSLQGQEIDLAEMKGKVVLVDFWATWCGPCIAELPHMLKTYEKYHEQGFEIIGVSLDSQSSKTRLESFIKAKNMPWPQLFDGKGWKSELAVKYMIKSIPATFLIGPDGTVVATNLRGDALEKNVSKYFTE